MTVHDGSPYAHGLALATEENFKAKLGGTVLSQEAVDPKDVDMHPLLTRIASEKPEVLYFPIFVAAGAQILRQAKDTPGLEKIPLIGSSGMLAADLIEAAKDSVVGFQITYPDLSRAGDGQGLSGFRGEIQEGLWRGADRRLPRLWLRRRGARVQGDRKGRQDRRQGRHLHRQARPFATPFSGPPSTASAGRSSATNTANAASSIQPYTSSPVPIRSRSRSG